MKDLLKLQTWLIGLKFFSKIVLVFILGIVVDFSVRLLCDIIPEQITYWFVFFCFIASILLCLLVLYIFIKHGLFRVPYPNGDKFDWSIEGSLAIIIFFLYLGVIGISGFLELFFDYERIFTSNQAIYISAIWLGSWTILAYFEHIDLLKEEDWSEKNSQSENGTT